MALFNTFSCTLLLTLLALVFAAPVPDTDFDVVVVGGGPAGLSGISGLGRVRRTVRLYDSGVYRNGATRHMHDIIGNDGTDPAVFRALARKQIGVYNTTEIVNGTVTSIKQEEDYFRITDNEGGDITARKILLGTGLRDVLPDTPGLKEAWSKGIFWCPWCDGFEHRDQPFGVLGPLSDVMGSVLEVETLNKDIIAFLNGTETPAEKKALAAKYPDWEAQFKAYNIKLDNRTVTSIDRLQDGSKVNDSEKHLEFDKFRINFSKGKSVVRNAIITNYPAVQRSTLPAKLGLKIEKEKIAVDQDSMRTSLQGVFAIGDSNNDSSTNVPHAMFSGKRAAVFVHVEMAREESKAAIGKRGSRFTKRELEKEANRLIGDNLEPLLKKARRT